MKKFKRWLYECDDQGFSRFDAIVSSIIILTAFVLPALLIKFLG